MSNNPILSIITVTKNCASSIERTLNSVATIKTSEIEYIVIDGNSIDGTVELINSKTRLLDRFISEHDSGIYNAMNKGIDLARGKFTLFINGDDQISPNDFSQVLSCLKKDGVDIYCAISLVPGLAKDDNMLLVMNQWLLPFYNSVPHPSAFVRTSLLKQYRFREDLKIASDYDLFLRLFMARKSFQKINVVSAIHYRGGASGNAHQSSFEVYLVRKERLGIFFYMSEFVLVFNRLLKKLNKAKK